MVKSILARPGIGLTRFVYSKSTLPFIPASSFKPLSINSTDLSAPTSLHVHTHNNDSITPFDFFASSLSVKFSTISILPFLSCTR